MNELWKHFEAWLSVHWPDGLATLNPPAADEEIAALERALGGKLPRDYIDCLKVHNGQSDEAGGLFDGSEFLSASGVLRQWKVWKDLLDSGSFEGIHSEPQQGIRNAWWNVLWVPFTHDGAETITASTWRRPKAAKWGRSSPCGTTWVRENFKAGASRPGSANTSRPCWLAGTATRKTLVGWCMKTSPEGFGAAHGIMRLASQLHHAVHFNR